jgi:ADP-ribosylglycohydrolase
VTHNHPEGIKGAQATACGVFLARTGHSKDEIRAAIAGRFGYDLDTPLDMIRPGYTFDVSCQGSVPQAIRAFLEAADYEDAVRQAISLGGDSDTQAAIAGGIAEAFYGGVPAHIAAHVWDNVLDEPLRRVVQTFRETYGPAGAPQ